MKIYKFDAEGLRQHKEDASKVTDPYIRKGWNDMSRYMERVINEKFDLAMKAITHDRNKV